MLIVLAWLFTALLLVLAVTCVAARAGMIRLNHLFGIRLPSLMRSESAWRRGHAAGILPASTAFVVALAFSIAGLFVPVAYAGSIVVAVFGVIWVMVRSSQVARGH